MGALTLNRRTFLRAITLGGGLFLTPLPRIARAMARSRAGDVAGLREKIQHVIVIYQENRSFDHYFGTYVGKGNAWVENLLDRSGHIDPRFSGQQRNEAGVPYRFLPVPDDIPGFGGAQLRNQPFHLAPYIPATHNVPWDPEHHFFRMYAQVDGGRMDRFVALAQACHHKPFDRDPGAHLDAVALTSAESRPSGAVLGFYQRDDIPAYHRLADHYVLFDHFFQAMSGGSTGNALYLAAARSAVWHRAPERYRGSLSPPFFDLPYDRSGVLINDLPPVLGPTEARHGRFRIAPPPEEQSYPNIGDRLNGAGISWAWYNEGWDAVKPWAMKRAGGPGEGSAVVDSLSTYEPHHNPFQYYPSWFDNVRGGHIRDANDFREDIHSGRLPAVSFLKATAAHDEHPAQSAPRWGMNWVMEHLMALGESPLWEQTAVLITYDEGGGFWDHVAPPRPDFYGCGTRIPALLVSPYAKPGYVDHTVADTTAILRFLETRFNLEPLTARDTNAYDLLGAFDFRSKARDASFN